MNSLIQKIVKLLVHKRYSLTLKIENLGRGEKSVALSNLSIYYSWKNVKEPYKTMNLKYQLQHGTRNLIPMTHHILYKFFKTTLKT